MFLSFSMCFIQFFSFPVKQDLIFLIFVAKIDVFSEIQISAIFELISCFFSLRFFSNGSKTDWPTHYKLLLLALKERMLV